jgi:hypothetical protein
LRAGCYTPAKSNQTITANRTVTPNPSAIFHMRPFYRQPSAGRERFDAEAGRLPFRRRL